jgi:hypothetical protein
MAKRKSAPWTRPFLWTIVELPSFVRAAENFWTKQERSDVIVEIATHAPTGDDLIPGSNGCWKSRQPLAQSGKSGGARVIYYIDVKQQRIILLTAYQKVKLANIPGYKLAELVKEIR